MPDSTITCDSCPARARFRVLLQGPRRLHLCGECIDVLAEGSSVILEAAPLTRPPCPFCNAPASAVLNSYGVSCECGEAPPLPFTPEELRTLSPKEDVETPF